MAGLKRITDLPIASSVLGDELIEVSQVSTTVRIVGTTISAQASDNSFNDSGNGFITAGFAVGDRVRITGFTGNVANNIVAAVVTALTAGKMTIGGADGDVIVDDAAGESVTIAKWFSRRLAIDDLPSSGGGGGPVDESLIIAVGDETTNLSTGTAKVTFRMPYAFTLSAVRASLSAASSSGTPTIDINEDGVSILSTKLTIDASEKTSLTALTPAVISDPDLADDAEITIDIDVSGTNAKGLKVILIGQQA
jgi:hypothetical protein